MGVKLAAANGANAGTSITSSNKLAVRRYNFSKMAEDASKQFQVPLLNFTCG
jgi:hypothetical protein